MVVRIRFKMYNQLIRMSNNVRRGQGFGAGTQSYIQDTYKIHDLSLESLGHTGYAPSHWE